MSLETKRLYEFGPYRIDGSKRILLRDGEVVQLTPKPFDLLVLLVESGGEVLSKEHLMGRLWPDSFVEEGNLTVAVSTLRKALGESPGQHRYIVTVPGKGYKFVADVRPIWDETAILMIQEKTRSHVVIEQEEVTQKDSGNSVGQTLASLAPGKIQATASRPLVFRRILTIACLLMFAAFAIAAVWWQLAGARGGSKSAYLPSYRIHQVENWKSQQSEYLKGSRFSPMGDMVTFTSNRAGHNDIWVKQIIGEEPIAVTEDEWEDWSSIWSPDGQRVAFVSNRGNDLGIWTAPAFGGTATPTMVGSFDPEGSPEIQLVRWTKGGGHLLRAELKPFQPGHHFG